MPSSTHAHTHSTPIASPVAPMFVSMVPVMEEQVQSKLELDGHLHLMEAAHLMPKGLQEAILADMVPISWFVLMRERAGELRRGHLATEESDSSPGAIHWFEGMYVQGIHVTYIYNYVRNSQSYAYKK